MPTPAAGPEEMWRAPSGSLRDGPQLGAVMEPQNADHGLEGTLKDHLAPNALPWAEIPSRRPGRSKPHPTWPSALSDVPVKHFSGPK